MKNMIGNVGKRKDIYRRGFSLVETLVAITMLAFALVGPLTVVSSSLVSSRYARDQVTAFSLAQEAVEYVRNVRDTNHMQIQKGNLARSSWLSGLSQCLDANNCAIDVFANTIYSATFCGLGSCPIRFSNGVYGYSSSWPDSIFTRTINIKTISGVEAAVYVTVSWKTGNLPLRSFTVKETLLNW